jgi:hypothetical protein
LASSDKQWSIRYHQRDERLSNHSLGWHTQIYRWSSKIEVWSSIWYYWASCFCRWWLCIILLFHFLIRNDDDVCWLRHQHRKPVYVRTQI